VHNRRRKIQHPAGNGESLIDPLNQRFTRREVARIVGVSERQLRYWERLRLVRPRARWGQRFYSFGDLAASRTIREITAQRVPARRLRRALVALVELTGQDPGPLSALRVFPRGRQVVVVPPTGTHPPIEPLTRQLGLPLGGRSQPGKVRAIITRTAEQWFELGLSCDIDPASFTRAVEAYRRALDLAPEWIEARINLGVTLYQLWQLEEAEDAFRQVLRLDPKNATALFNLGCVLYELGELDQAIRALRRAARLAPASADTHLNLALTYEKTGAVNRARRHWGLYLRYAPNGPWAEHARTRVQQSTPRGRRSSKVTAFPRRPVPPAEPLHHP
jgi:Tfp pilus assembly protein PilF